jgi:hypothetical protein
MKRILLFSLLLLPAIGIAQPQLDQFVKNANQYNSKRLQEKVFVHLDRAFYVAGESAWLKIYLVDGYIHHPIHSSKVVYLEILDETNLPIVQTKVSVMNGIGHGTVALPAALSSGNYRVRAYTHWMKNFSPEHYFNQLITIVNVFRRLDEKVKSENPKLDIQFFPEGGQLVDGIQSKVAYRVVDASGKGISFVGSILTAKGDTIVRFKPLRFGMGNFYFTPDARDQYQVIIQDAKGLRVQTTLPSIQSTGYTMQVKDTLQNSVHIKIREQGTKNSSPVIYLIGHTRQTIKVASAHSIKDGTASVIISRDILGEGISHLTIFNAEFKPLCERLIFNRPENKISLSTTTDLPEYDTRSKIKLTVKAENIEKDSINLSVSVFKMDSLQQFFPTDIQSFIWLTSELNGRIESPAYYLTQEAYTTGAVDNLMLTHGWSRFTWKNVIEESKSPIRFLPEYRGHLISGKIIDRVSEKPKSGVLTYLSAPSKKIQSYESVSDAQGNIVFETNEFYGKRKLIVQTSQADSLVRIELVSPFSTQFLTSGIPSINLTEKFAKQITTRSISMQIDDAFKKQNSVNTLSPSDNSSFYGQPSEQYNLDDYTRFPVMEEVIREYIKGVRLRKKDDQFIFKVLNTSNNSVFEREPLVLLDGVPIFNTHQLMALDPLKVQHLDVITNKYLLGSLTFDGIVSFRTYLGDLGGYQFSPKTLQLDYDALQAQKEFFSPRYETQQQKENRIPDARHLLYWLPDLTLSNQDQSLDFYSSDQPGIYQAVIQGITANGRPVFKTHSFTVKSKR